jgi:hypothetical protein
MDEFTKKVMDKLMLEVAEVDAMAYSVAAQQASDILAELRTHLPYTIYIVVSGRSFPLTVLHTDVCNEVFIMLDELTKLREEVK